MVKYKPIADKVIILKEVTEEKTKNGLFIPASAEQDICAGEVIAVGPGRWDNGRVPLTVKVGDRVYIGRYSGVPLGDKHTVVVTEQEILAIEDEDGK